MRCRWEPGCAISAASRAPPPARKRRVDVRIRSPAPPDRGSPRHRDTGRDRGRLRHHGGNPDQGRCARAARQHAADRRDTGGAHHHSRADIGRAFQSRGLAGVCAQARTDAARGAVVRGGADRGRHRRHHHGARDVRAAAAGCVAEGANRRRAMAGRGRGRVRPGCDDPGRHQVQPAGDPVAGRALHHGGLLVHLVDVVCQSGRRHREIADQYVLGHSPGRSARFHCRRTVRRASPPCC